MESDMPKLGFYVENRGGEGIKIVILTRKTAPHPMDVGRNRVRGGRRARDDAGGGGEQGGERTGRGRFPMGRRGFPKERRWRSVRRYAFSEGRCAFAAEKGRRRENRGQGERTGRGVLTGIRRGIRG